MALSTPPNNLHTDCKKPILPAMTAAEVTFNPFDPAVMAAPYPYYHRMRERDPVHWSHAIRTWFLTRHADVVELLRDDRFSADRTLSERFRPPPPHRRRPGKSMLVVDPPDHTRLRNLVNKAFTPRMVERLRPRIEAITTEILDRVAGVDGFDLVTDFAYPLPAIVLAEMLGVPAKDRMAFQQWSAVLVRGLDPMLGEEEQEAAFDARDALLEYLRAVVAALRRAPQEDMLTNLIAAEETGAMVSEG